MIVTPAQLEHEALLMLDDRGAILDVARRISGLMDRAGTVGGVIGGVAVNLHGRLRVTSDVDVYVAGSLSDFADHLRAEGFDFDADRREFSSASVPVHLINDAQAVPNPTHFETIRGIRTVSLADLINLKLRTGLRNAQRGRDLGDVVDLIQANRLDGQFAARIEKSMRNDFRRLVRAIQSAPPPPATGDPFSHLG